MTDAILLDIEGTTTPIDFVHKTLFPFAKERMDQFVFANFDELKTQLGQLKAESLTDAGYDQPFDEKSPASVSAYLKYLIDQDRKSTPLKSIQGQIWKVGYSTGKLCSQVFQDVPRALARWQAAENEIAIYSSGSVLAQKLLFKFTSVGDLSPFIDSYFDTNTGAKRAASSYVKIAEAMGIIPENILFVSDSIEELDAAAVAGLRCFLSVRPGNGVVRGRHEYVTITSFDDIL